MHVCRHRVVAHVILTMGTLGIFKKEGVSTDTLKIFHGKRPQESVILMLLTDNRKKPRVRNAGMYGGYFYLELIDIFQQSAFQ